MAWYPNRLARNSIDGGRIIYLLDTGKIKDSKFLTFWFDSTPPQGKFMINIAFGQSKYCIDNLSENINRGHQAKLRKGIWSNFAPLEYSNEFYATGEYILKALAKVLDHAGLRSYKSNVLSISYVQRLLQNSIYYGVFSFNDEIYNRTHELIISKKLFGSIQ